MNSKASPQATIGRRFYEFVRSVKPISRIFWSDFHPTTLRDGRSPQPASFRTEKGLAGGPGGGDERPWSAHGRAEIFRMDAGARLDVPVALFVPRLSVVQASIAGHQPRRSGSGPMMSWQTRRPILRE